MSKPHLYWEFDHRPLCELPLTPDTILHNGFTHYGINPVWYCAACQEKLHWIQRVKADPILARALGYTGALPLTWTTIKRATIQTAKDAFYPLLGLAGLAEMLRLLSHH